MCRTTIAIEEDSKSGEHGPFSESFTSSSAVLKAIRSERVREYGGKSSSNVRTWLAQSPTSTRGTPSSLR